MLVPTVVDSVEGAFCTSISCGSYHTMAIMGQGDVFSWGQGLHGQLGIGGYVAAQTSPRRIEALQWKGVIQLVGGKRHSAALTESGDVYTWGDGKLYQLGLGDDYQPKVTPRRVDFLSGRQVCQLTSGVNHCVAISSMGTAYTWGTAADDAEATGSNCPTQNKRPELVRVPDGMHILSMSAGAGHNHILCAKRAEVKALSMPSSKFKVPPSLCGPNPVIPSLTPDSTVNVPGTCALQKGFAPSVRSPAFSFPPTNRLVTEYPGSPTLTSKDSPAFTFDPKFKGTTDTSTAARVACNKTASTQILSSTTPTMRGSQATWASKDDSRVQLNVAHLDVGNYNRTSRNEYEKTKGVVYPNMPVDPYTMQ